MFQNFRTSINRHLELSRVKEYRDGVFPDIKAEDAIALEQCASYLAAPHRDYPFNAQFTRVSTKSGLVYAENNLGRELLYCWRTVGYDSYTFDALERGEFTREGLYYACADFALSMTCLDERCGVNHNLFYIHPSQSQKIERWKEMQAASPERNIPRLIEMELYPRFFDFILHEKKSVEGRAFKPMSDKDYPGMRPGDTIRFTINKEREDWMSECVRYGIDLGAAMTAKISDIYFGYLVVQRFHDMAGRGAGEGYQPQIEPHEDPLRSAVTRAAVYYSIPGYRDLIRDHGFIGIELEDPQLAN